jgi:hypothetical protein
MTQVPIYNLHDLGVHAQGMARDCKNERLALILQSVAIGSMIIMTGAAATHILKDLFGHSGRQDRSR